MEKAISAGATECFLLHNLFFLKNKVGLYFLIWMHYFTTAIHKVCSFFFLDYHRFCRAISVPCYDSPLYSSKALDMYMCMHVKEDEGFKRNFLSLWNGLIPLFARIFLLRTWALGIQALPHCLILFLIFFFLVALETEINKCSITRLFQPSPWLVWSPSPAENIITRAPPNIQPSHFTSWSRGFHQNEPLPTTPTSHTLSKHAEVESQLTIRSKPAF